MPNRWSSEQEKIVKDLFKKEKSFEEISQVVNRHIGELNYNTYFLRSPRAVAFKCMALGFISLEELNIWDKKRSDELMKDRHKDLYNVRKEVSERDNNECVFCGSKEKLEFAHIIPFIETRKNMEKEG